MKTTLKRFITFYLITIFFEITYSFLMYDSFTKINIINKFLFIIIFSTVLTIITGIFKDKINKIILYVWLFISGFWFSLQFVFNKVYGFSFTFDYFKQTDQMQGLGNEILTSILTNIYGILLFFLPFTLLLIFKKKYTLTKLHLKEYITYILIIIIGLSSFYLNVYINKEEKYSAHYLLNDINDNSLNIEKLGIYNALLINGYRSIFGFKEVLIDTVIKPKTDDIMEYEYNELDLNLTKSTTNKEIEKINNYISKQQPTEKNKYTGLFEGKNLIYITAESFSDMGISEELTPTLYKLINSGFVFENYYSSNSLSTLGGEFQILTGLYPDSSIVDIWKKGTNSFPYGLGNIFKSIGYNTYSYHNQIYTYQNRNKYLKALGFDSYKACGNGLEKKMNCRPWPNNNSDVELITASIDDYINKGEPFVAYYMTNSGHLPYNSSNNMYIKNKSLVKDLKYNVPIKAYLASQIELDRAIELLIKKLEEANILDDTVIVLAPDHYPYNLTISDINTISSYKKDEAIEVNRGQLIIWNNKVKDIKISKITSAIDVLPTIYNLFGIEFDSRLFVGKDIFSNSYGLAIFHNRFWKSDYGTSKDKITDDKYDTTLISNEVDNRITISKLIIKSNYYKYISNQ